jgi:multimeric flavodoxin WrbA
MSSASPVARSPAAVPTLLIVHHTVSPAMQELFDAVLSGTSAEGIEGVDVEVRPALSAGVTDVLAADGFLLGTPANIGYLSGAMKYFFDNVYYPCQTAKQGAPYGLYVHGNNSVDGAARAAASITKGMGWEQVHDPVLVTGAVTAEIREACWDLGATVAAHVAGLA